MRGTYFHQSDFETVWAFGAPFYIPRKCGLSENLTSCLLHTLIGRVENQESGNENGVAKRINE